MIKLLNKNVLLNHKNIFLGILASVFFACISLDGYKYYPVALMMCPALLFTFVVGKMCYMEDSISTKQFLMALPITKKDLIFEKNILSYLCIVIGEVIANSVGILISVIKQQAPYFNFNLIIGMSIFVLLYNTLFIWLNYKYDYSKTQFTPYILLGMMLLLFKFGTNFLAKVSSKGPSFLSLCAIGAAAIFLNYIILEILSKNKRDF